MSHKAPSLYKHLNEEALCRATICRQQNRKLQAEYLVHISYMATIIQHYYNWNKTLYILVEIAPIHCLKVLPVYLVFSDAFG